MKRFLLISYTFPPSGGGGVQRPLKFVKYVGRHGWEPVVATPDRPSSPVWDEGLLKQLPPGLVVEHLRSLEPRAGDAPASGTGGKAGLKVKVAAMLFPDRHVLWLPTALPGLLMALVKHRPRAVMVSAPPFSSFLLGWLAAAVGRLPLVLDFRDEWSGFYARGFNPTEARGPWAAAVTALERRLVRRAARVLCASPDYAWRFRDLYGGPPEKYLWVPNGFDPDDYPSKRPPPLPGPATRERPLTILYAGSVHEVTSLRYLWQGLALLTPDQRRSLRVTIMGRVNPDQVADPGLEGLKVEVKGYVDHDQALAAMTEADLLLLTLSPGPGVERVIPGKLYEYLGAGRPILALTPPGRAAAMAAQAGGGAVVAPARPDELARRLAAWLLEPPSPTGPPPPEFDRRMTVRLLARALDEAVALGARP